MKLHQNASAPLALPRQFSRIFGKLRNLPPDEGTAIAKAAYDRCNDPRQRHLAMRLRLRLLHDQYGALHRHPDTAAQIEETPQPPVQEVVTPPAEVIPPPPPPRKKQPKMMMMNLESNDLSAMMDALSDQTEDLA